MGGYPSVDDIEDDGFSDGDAERDSVIRASGSEAEVLGPVDTLGLDDGAFEICCDGRFGRVRGIDAPVNFAE